jgi:hypothetical protein
MARKPRFPTEPETRPDARRKPTARQSGPAPKDLRERSEAPTMPPPRAARVPTEPPTRPRRTPPPRGSDSGIRAGKPDVAAATVDEVTADLSKDPRRERDEGDGEDGN